MYEYTNGLVIALGLILFTVLSLLRREWGIYLIVLLLPAYQIRFALFGIPLTFLEGMILVLATIEFFDLLFRKAFLAKVRLILGSSPTTFILIFLLLLAALVSIFVSPVPLKGAGIFKAYFLEAILFYFLCLLLIDNEKKLKNLFLSLTFLILYLSIFGIYQFVTLTNLPFSWWAVNVASRRITSLVNHPNALALLSGPILAILIALPLSSKTWGKNKLLMVASGLGLVTLYLSFSRAAWLALLITSLGLLLITPLPRPGERSKPLVKILLVVLTAVLIITLIPYSRSKILDLTRGQDLAQKNRLVLWSAAADILKKHPIAGVGLMGFREHYKNYPLGPDRVVQNYPHNFFLNFWLETGFFGMLAMIGLLILFFRRVIWLTKTPWRSLGLATASGMAMVVLHGLVDVSYFKNDLSMLFWLIYALPNLPFLSKTTADLTSLTKVEEYNEN